MRALYENDFRPQPLSFAGINMNFLGFGALAKRSGAIFVRRSFGDDPVYKLVFRHYIDFLVGKRLPLSWSIEGTRSRTGKLMPPKLGLINWVIDAYRRAACADVLLVPVSISFDQIAEIDDYVAMQRGLPKRKESLKWFIGYIFGMKKSHGKIFVRFAKPLAVDSALSDLANVSDAMLADHQNPNRVAVQKLAFEVSSRIEHATPITSTDLVTLVLLAANGRALTSEEISTHVGEITPLIEHRKLPTAGHLDFIKSEGLGQTLDQVVRTSLLNCYDKGDTNVYSIAPGKQLAAAYYRNTIIHYFLSGALAEMALFIAAEQADDAEGPTVQEIVLNLRDLLKFEFFFEAKTEFLLEVDDYLNSRYPTWKNGADPDAAFTTAPLFGHSILRSFIESYFILSKTLLAKSGESIPDSAHKALLKNCLEYGEELLLRRKISSETGLSQPILANAIRLAAYRNLLKGVSEDLQSGRNVFADEMDQALAAINRLQQTWEHFCD